MAAVRYFADLPRGSIGAYAYATGDVTDVWPYGFTATGRVEKINFQISLYFDVEAGTYPDGVEVSVEGVAHGTLSATTSASARFQYWYSFAGSYTAPLKTIANDDAYTISFTEPFTKSTQIVASGVVLTEPQRFIVTLSAGLSNSMTDTNLDGTSPNYLTGSAVVDVYSGLQFTDVIVPDGVTWTSPDGVFMSHVTGDDVPCAPEGFVLYQNSPNPFNPVTSIAFDLPRPGNVSLRIYDVKGGLVATLADGYMTEGRKELTWSATDSGGRPVASGVYFYRLDAGGFTRVRKMVLLK
jgi:hypothetical protein